MIIRVTLLVTFLYFVYIVQPTLNQSPGYNPLNLDDNTENLSLFGKELYRLCTSSDVFQKVFALKLSVYEAADALYKSAVYWDKHLGLGLRHPGSLPLQISLSCGDAFARGITPVIFFKVYSNTAEDYLSKVGAFTSYSAEQLANLYYKEIEKKLREVELKNNAEYSPPYLYVLTSSSVNFYGLFGELSQEVIRHTQVFFVYQWNNVPGRYVVEECTPLFNDIYQKHADSCTGLLK